MSSSRSPPTLLSAVALALAGLAACTHANERGLDARNFDAKTPACLDFFQHANGGWLKANPIPPAFGEWGLDNELNERNLELLRHVLESAAAQPGAPGSNAQKLGDFYRTAMDESAIEKAGIAPLRDDLAAIAALTSTAQVAALMRAWQVRGLHVPFELQAQEDLQDSRTAIAYAGQGGLGLPDRDYYVREDATSRMLRKRYRAHVARMLDLLGDTDPQREADGVLALESRLARASLDRVALREPMNSYHLVTLPEADAKTPHFSWTALFHDLGRDDVARFSLAQPDFFATLDQALSDVPVAQWRAYLRWQLIDATAPYLSGAFVAADFDFHQRTLRGVRQIKSRWRRVVADADLALGEALGEAYVAQTFPPAAKQRAVALVDNLKAALRVRLARLAWMSVPTREAAYAKLDTLVAKIGYPDRWRDYSKLEISTRSYADNMRAAAAFEARRQFAKFDRPADKSEWDLTPQTVNAYYNPMRNEIVFPAAQLQPPYFDAQADDALNYGAIGAVIGHEMLHGYDDEGSQFDAAGNLSGWWSPEDRAQFKRRTAQLAAQFDHYTVLDGLHLNGSASLGENIADLGGLLVAYDAFKLTAQGKGGGKIDGLTADQRFFHAFAQGWRAAQRPETLRLQVQSNEHAPAKFRVNGPLSNLPAFAAAFGCKPGDTMVRAQAIEIW